MARKDAHPGRKEQVKLRRQQALALRIGGASYRQIASSLGIEVSAAHKDVQDELAETAALHDDEREEVRRLEIERLDKILIGQWNQAASGHQGAVDRVLKIMERRARLLGLDEPVKNVHTGPNGTPLFRHVTAEEIQDIGKRLLEG